MRKKKYAGSLEIVAAGARHDVHRADAGDAGRQIEVGRRELELLDDFLREVHPGVALDVVADVAAVHRDRRLVGIAAENRHREQRVVLRGRSRTGRHARLEERQLQEAASVERQLLNFLARDHAADGMRFGLDMDGVGGDVDGFGRRAELHVYLDGRDTSGGDADFGQNSA